MLLKGDPNQAPPVVGVTDQNINRPYCAARRRHCGASARCRASARSTTTACCIKFQRRFADNFSVLNSYTWNKAIDLNSDNDGGVTLTNVYDPQYNRGPSDYDVTHTLSSSWVYELPVGRAALVGQLADQRHPLPALGPALHRHADAGRAVHRHRQPPEPHRRRPARQPDDRAVVRHVGVPRAGRRHGHLRRLRPQHPAWTRPVQHRLLDDQEHEDRQPQHRVPGRGLQPAEPPAVRAAQRHSSATRRSARSRRCCPTPSCALCGTTERNIQFAIKVNF